MPRIQMDFFSPGKHIVYCRSHGRPERSKRPVGRVARTVPPASLYKKRDKHSQLTVPRGLRVATPVAGVPTPARPRPQGNIYIDGFCGDQTIGFIKYFQAMMLLKQVGAIEVNGQVAPQGTPAAKTMYMLNATLNALTRPWVLTQSDAFPQELRDSFYFYL